MSFSKAVDVQWSAVHEHLTSPGVSASVSVLCELGVREKRVQDGGVEGLYFCSDCMAVGLGSNRKSTWGHLISEKQYLLLVFLSVPFSVRAFVTS